MLWSNYHSFYFLLIFQCLELSVYVSDVCISENLPEVELVSLVSESLPKYKLRADTITDFTNYQNQDWGIKQPPLVPAHSLQLSNEQIEEVFKYFSKYV